MVSSGGATEPQPGQQSKTLSQTNSNSKTRKDLRREQTPRSKLSTSRSVREMGLGSGSGGPGPGSQGREGVPFSTSVV